MSRRQAQVNSLLQQELSMYWEREIELPANTILSVARVEVAPSLDVAHVFVSVWPEDKQAQVVAVLNEDIYQTQKYIDKRLYMKKVPKLDIMVDEQTLARREVEDVLDALQDNESSH